jgi:hypothetical protein
MKQFGFKYESELERVEESLQVMREEFEHYRADYESAYDKLWMLIEEKECGFSISGEGELQEQRMMDAVEAYFRLSMLIDLWLRRVQLIVTRISKIERKALGEREIFVDEGIRASALLSLGKN